MHNISRGTFLKGASLTALAGVFAACSTGSNDSANSSSSESAASAEAGAFPVTLKSPYGETKLEQAPAKIAVVNAWKNADVLLSFNVVPVAMPKISWGQNSQDSTDWFDTKLKELGKNLDDIKRYDETDAPDYEALAQAAPDAIFAPYGKMDQETFDKLSKIAPVVSAPEGEGPFEVSWQHVVEQAGKMLGRPSDAQKIISDTEKNLKDLASQHSDLEGATFIAGYFDSEKKTFGAYTGKDSRPQAFVDLGMKEAPYVVEHSKDAQSVFLDISAEQLDQVECDVLWAWVENPHDTEKVKADPLFSKLPAIKNNAAIFEGNKQVGLAFSAASPLSLEWVLKDTKFLEQFSTAIQNTKKAQS